MRGLLAAAVVALALALALAAAVPAAAESGGKVVTLPLREAIEAVPMAAEDRTGFERSAFRHWVDADDDGCSTRAEVLIAEAVEAPAVGTGCRLTGGRWYSYYDDAYVDGVRGLGIDHLVPLAEAWDSGASTWPAERRRAYANDLGAEASLAAVTARSQRSRAAKDVAEWWITAEGAGCRYLEEWTATKLRWKLAADSNEHEQLLERADHCPNAPLTVGIA